MPTTEGPSAGTVGSAGHIEFYTNNFTPGEEPIGNWFFSNFLIGGVVTAWGGEFAFANVEELLDIEIEYVNHVTRIVPVEIDAAGTFFFLVLPSLALAQFGV